MKSRLLRFVAFCLVIFVGLTISVQSPALAGRESNAEINSGGSVRIPGLGPRDPRLEALRRSSRPSVANPVGSQPAPGESIEDFRERTGRENSSGAGGRDAGQRERNRESGHRGHGGPLDS